MNTSFAPKAPSFQQPRARGVARITSKASPNHGAIDQLHHSGALKLLFPRGRTGVEAVLVNTAGGITGGDHLQLEAVAGKDSQLTLTTQAAERAYRAQPGETGRQETRLRVEDGARMHWLPQETILFQSSAYARSLRADLDPGARFLLVEPVVFGRTAMGETVTEAQFSDRIEIFRAGQRIYHDQLRLAGDLQAMMARPAVGGTVKDSARAMASLVLAAPDAEAALPFVREQFEQIKDGSLYGGASLLAPELMVARVLATDAYALRLGLLPILDRLTDMGLPRCWRL